MGHSGGYLQPVMPVLPSTYVRKVLLSACISCTQWNFSSSAMRNNNMAASCLFVGRSANAYASHKSMQICTAEQRQLPEAP